MSLTGTDESRATDVNGPGNLLEMIDGIKRSAVMTRVRVVRAGGEDRSQAVAVGGNKMIQERNRVEYPGAKEPIRLSPFDAAPCAKASMDDLDSRRMARFIRTARRARGFPLTEDVCPEELLEHLNLLSGGRPTNAAVLLFGKSPQRFLISSEIRCAHFHGTEVEKPIPYYQVYKGTAFDLVDQAVDFVLSKINRSIGTRAESVRAPTTYEIPREVVNEAVVNAVAHQDYSNNAGVQVMLFADRLEIRNPGRLPSPITLEKLRGAHSSVPANPLLAESLYLAEYTERRGTGMLDMIQRCVGAGLPEPEFAVADGFVATIRRGALSGRTARHRKSQQESRQESLEAKVLSLLAADRPMSRSELSKRLGQKKISGQLNKTIRLLMRERSIEYTLPDKPQSRFQKYRLTDQGRAAASDPDAGNVKT